MIQKQVGSKSIKKMNRVPKRNQTGRGSFKNRVTLNRKIERIENGITYLVGGRIA